MAGWWAAALAMALSFPAKGHAFTDEEREVLARYRSLLEVPPDPCGIAAKLEDRYKAILRDAAPEQAVAEAYAAVAGAAGIPLRIGDGLRLMEGFALYDPETRAIYLSSPSVTSRLGVGRGCPDDARVRALADETVGVYVHEVFHALERQALGFDLVATSEGEVLAYVREARFLTGLRGWPSAAVSAEVERRGKLDALVLKNREILGRVEAMRGEDPTREGLERLSKYVETLEGIRRDIEKLAGQARRVDPLQVSLLEMVRAWREGWTPFIELLRPDVSTRPSLAQPQRHLSASLRFLEDSRRLLTHASLRGIERDAARRGLALAEADVRFWGDEAKVEAASDYFRKRFAEIRPKGPAERPKPGASAPVAANDVSDLPDELHLDSPEPSWGGMKVPVSTEAMSFVDALYALPTSTMAARQRFWGEISRIQDSLDHWRSRVDDPHGRRVVLGRGVQQLLWRMREAVEGDPLGSDVWGGPVARLNRLRDELAGDPDPRLKSFLGRFVTGRPHLDWRKLKKEDASIHAKWLRSARNWKDFAREGWENCESAERDELSRLEAWDQVSLARFQKAGLSRRQVETLRVNQRGLAEWRLVTLWGNYCRLFLVEAFPAAKDEPGLEVLPVRLHWDEFIGLVSDDPALLRGDPGKSRPTP